ncbi:DedA family protein [Peribacillus sp. B-H-3]|uniref:DedA family protein n=1 Tax=Peribacillus sp. B-H-3 TaxID=3400420 RepID=UPI003B015B0B
MSEFIMKILEFFSGLGYFGIMLGLMIEIIPSEFVLGYGGFLIGKGDLNFFLATVFGVAGGTIAQLFLYWAGYFGGRPFLLKYGKYILIKEKQIDMAERWFEKYGVGVIFSARFIPVVRHAISIPAGIAKMSWAKFTLYTVAALIPWTVLFLYLGMALGSNWKDIKEKAAPIVLPVMILAFVIAAVYFVWKKKRTPPIVTVPRKKKD